MAVFDDAISQPPLSWAIGCGDVPVASDDDRERPEGTGEADARPDAGGDR